MYCDNTGAITNESRITKGARHFRAKFHYLREVIEYGHIKLEKVHTYDNLADLFTKALAFPKHSEHTRNIGMLPASIGVCGGCGLGWAWLWVGVVLGQSGAVAFLVISKGTEGGVMRREGRWGIG
ncbi:hypothetical protein Tco_0860046 [Tanacetum coccineum]|uniref:Uncharacterized protein n=1 Tax=Tanacetum coccineum TaxID=301880 RepID=A0ABQ5BHS3_9ASTR